MTAQASGCADIFTSVVRTQPVELLGRVGRYTCTQSAYELNASSVRGSRYSVRGLSVSTGSALGSGAAYTGMSTSLVVALWNCWLPKSANTFGPETARSASVLGVGVAARLAVVTALGEREHAGRGDEHQDHDRRHRGGESPGAATAFRTRRRRPAVHVAMLSRCVRCAGWDEGRCDGVRQRGRVR